MRPKDASLPPLPVTILASAYPLEREVALGRVRDERPGTALVRHELGQLASHGVLHRAVDGPAAHELTVPVDASCCLSCLLRDDTLAALARLRDGGVDDAVLVLPATVDPALVASALHDADHVEVRAVVAAVAVQALEPDLDDPSPCPLDALPGDDAPITRGELIVQAVRHADVVLLAEGEDRAATLVAALAPSAAILSTTGPTAGWVAVVRHDPAALSTDTAVGVPRPVRTLELHGVSSGRWVARRPLHAQRLADAIESGELEGLIHATGHVWVASRPATILELEVVTSSYEIAAAGVWLDAIDDQPVHPMRARHARRVAHPYWGDRTQDLALTSLDRPLAALVAVLDGCLVTDLELAAGEDGWRQLPDPFGGLGDEADHLAPLQTRDHRRR